MNDFTHLSDSEMLELVNICLTKAQRNDGVVRDCVVCGKTDVGEDHEINCCKTAAHRTNRHNFVLKEVIITTNDEKEPRSVL